MPAEIYLANRMFGLLLAYRDVGPCLLLNALPTSPRPKVVAGLHRPKGKVSEAALDNA